VRASEGALYFRAGEGRARRRALSALAAKLRAAANGDSLWRVHYLFYAGTTHSLSAHYRTLTEDSALRSAIPSPILVLRMKLRSPARRVTNTTKGRSAYFAAGFDDCGSGTRPSTFIELGPSAGLTMHWQRCRYRYVTDTMSMSRRHEAFLITTAACRRLVPPLVLCAIGRSKPRRQRARPASEALAECPRRLDLRLHTMTTYQFSRPKREALKTCSRSQRPAFRSGACRGIDATGSILLACALRRRARGAILAHAIPKADAWNGAVKRRHRSTFLPQQWPLLRAYLCCSRQFASLFTRGRHGRTSSIRREFGGTWTFVTMSGLALLRNGVSIPS